MALRGFWGFDGGSTTMAYPEWNGYNSTTGRDGVANHASSLLSNSTCSLTVPGAPMSSLIVGYALGRGVWTATSNRPIARFMEDGWLGQYLGLKFHADEFLRRANWSGRQPCRQPNVVTLPVAA